METELAMIEAPEIRHDLERVQTRWAILACLLGLSFAA